MGTLRRALIITLAIVAAPLAASAAPGLLLSEQVDDKAKIEIGYLGEGWRNLRKVVVFTTNAGFDTADEYYFACGSSTLISPARIPVKDATYITAGSTIDLQTDRMLGFLVLTPALRSTVTSALNSACDAPTTRQTPPVDIGLAASKDQVSYLLAERFERSGSSVKMWMRADYIKAGDLNLGWLGEAPPVLDKWRGYVISKLEINCDTGRFRTTNTVAYDTNGEPVTGRSAASEYSAFIETVPGTVGEARVQRACLIR